MKILQRNLNRTTFVVWEMKRSVSVVRLKFHCNIIISVKIIKEMLDSVASGTPYITKGGKKSSFLWLVYALPYIFAYNIFFHSTIIRIPYEFRKWSTAFPYRNNIFLLSLICLFPLLLHLTLLIPFPSLSFIEIPEHEKPGTKFWLPTHRFPLLAHIPGTIYSSALHRFFYNIFSNFCAK